MVLLDNSSTLPSIYTLNISIQCIRARRVHGDLIVLAAAPVWLEVIVAGYITRLNYIGTAPRRPRHSMIWIETDYIT